MSCYYYYSVCCLCKDIFLHVAGNQSYIFHPSCIFNLVETTKKKSAFNYSLFSMAYVKYSRVAPKLFDIQKQNLIGSFYV